jgi:hypothetical protein
MVLSQALYLLKECFAEALNKQAKGYDMQMNHQIYQARTITYRPHEFIDVTRECKYNLMVHRQ